MAEKPHKVNSLTVNNIDIINVAFDPRVFGYSAILSSLLVDNTNGYIYRKYSSINDTDWELIYPKNITKNISTNYSILRDDSILIVNTTSGDITLTLPLPSLKTSLNIKKIVNVNKITINPNASELIDGDINLIITKENSNVSLVSNGTNWYIL
jgi:hypothetical protein